jgi:hypothetical protein
MAGVGGAEEGYFGVWRLRARNRFGGEDPAGGALSTVAYRGGGRRRRGAVARATRKETASNSGGSDR